MFWDVLRDNLGVPRKFKTRLETLGGAAKREHTAGVVGGEYTGGENSTSL